MNYQDYWLKPDGTLLEVPDIRHNEVAMEVVENQFGGFLAACEKLQQLNIDYPYEYLHHLGWVRVRCNPYAFEILGGCIDLTKRMRNTIDPAMNSLQMSTAKRLCEEYGISLNDAINDLRFHD